MRKFALLTATMLVTGGLAAPAFSAAATTTDETRNVAQAPANQAPANQAPAAAAGTNAGQVPAARSDDREDAEDIAEDRQEAQEIIAAATKVANQMASDGQARAALDKARGVFIVPDFAQGALIIGAGGGAGVFLARTDEGWGNPAFYEMGGLSFGAQAGGESGPMAFMLMTDKAVQGFRNDDDFTLSAEAGYTFGEAKDGAAATTDNTAKDVVVWSGTEGAFAGATVSVGDISYDEDRTAAYYGAASRPDQVLDGPANNEHGGELRAALGTRG
ncbi:lipid-binding SYLF domain-containing protein (plasmid) [Tistrella mobilis]|uniref:lipid-binding SYLF domain-containing protein n=1 Tax=Tistrella mobilis TaxID=171437 RepID=UPI003556A626